MPWIDQFSTFVAWKSSQVPMSSLGLQQPQLAGGTDITSPNQQTSYFCGLEVFSSAYALTYSNTLNWPVDVA